MKLSIFTTITNPYRRGDNIIDALWCYSELADEVIKVDGGDGISIVKKQGKSVTIHSHWPQEFSWPFIGEQFTKGYRACTGDIAIHADIDFIWHEKDFENIRKAAQEMLDQNLPAMSMYKWQFILPDRYNLKSRLVTMVNKRDFGDRIKFNSGGDLCQPSLDGKELKPDDVRQSTIPIYNYEKLLKTKEQIAEDQGRMERAWFRHFGEYQMKSDGTNEDALERWIQAQEGKFKKPQQAVKLEDHPKYVQETIKLLNQEQFGYNGFGRLGIERCFE